ncbi:MAG: hypothetical protein RLO81_03620 [Fulvivirga sp.]|uniref:hypothetical protein n=1 Tax=Fulvivirga sp. TaxID=1931237 RepID=UPI0032F0931E
MRLNPGKKVKIDNISREVVFDLSDRLVSRSYVYLLFVFHHEGYQIYLKNNLHFIGNLISYSRAIAGLSRLKLYKKKEINGRFLITDNPTDLNKKENKIILSVKMFEKGKLRHRGSVIPFMMIPRLYFSGMFKTVSSLRSTKRSMRIFFSGNSNRSLYNNQNFNKLFGKLTRIEILDTIKQNLRDSQLVCLNDLSRIKQNGFEDKFILSEWVRKKQNEKNLRGRTSDADWLKTLSHASFFLCCPGITQPMCHNLVEAMSVGTIPILEHSEFLNPSLTSGVNCITFSGKNDLIKKINQVLTMEESQIAKLRYGVLCYYDTYLTPKSIVKYLESKKETGDIVYVIESSYFANLLNQYS